MSDTPEIKLNEFGDLSRRQRRELEAKGIDPDTAVIEYLNTQSIPIQRPAEPIAEPVAQAEVVAEAVVEVAEGPKANSRAEPNTSNSTTEIPVVNLDVPTTTAEVFPASMSKRDIRNVLDRANPVDETLAPVTPISAAIDESIVDEPTIDGPVVHVDPFNVILAGAAADLELEAETKDHPAPVAIDEEVIDAEPAVADVATHDIAGDELEEELDESDDDEEYEVETYSGPTTISEATAAAALEEAIAAHNAARVDNGVELDAAELPSASDYEDFSGPSTGSIPTISNALILPTLPEDTGTIIPVVATGEVIVTEQLTLPSSIAQVGAEYGTLDTSELDVIADEEEIAPSQDLAPVRAASAVSSYNANNAVVTVPKRMSDRLPFVLSITAAGLAVAVVALFVTGYILGLF